MRILFFCLLLASSLVAGYSWVLKSTHTNIIPELTSDVSLRCFFDGRNNNNVVLSRLTRIRLLKRVTIKPEDWGMFAEIYYRNKSDPILADPNQPGVSVSGRLEQVNNSYLTVTWSRASDETVGTYKCEIDGFTAIIGTDIPIYTEKIAITNHAATVTDFLDIIVQLRRKSDQISKELKSIDNRHATQRQELENRAIADAKSAIEDNFFEVRYWPTESYTLLTDAKGCPDTPFSKLSSGYMNVQTETKVRPNHIFPAPFDYTVCTNCGTRNVLPFKFCSSSRAEPRLLWPKGTYCIHRFSSCPANFGAGYTRFFLDSLVSLIVTQANINSAINATVASKMIDFNFCCRSDSSVDIPILLPTSQPFYLYRYKGRCQTVYNMQVKNEYIQIDTDDTKADLFGNVYHADGTINNGRLELCYYTKKTSSP